MRSSSVGLFGVLAIASLAACSVSTTSNSITLKSQKQFTDSGQPAKSAPYKAGDAISINNDGIPAAIGEAGVTVTVDASATQVTVQPVFAAFADDDAHESDAKASIQDAIPTFTVTGGNGSPIQVSCHHGGDHGTSGGNKSGCILFKVTVPAGTAADPLDLTVGDGNGGIRFNGTPLVKKLVVQENGTGDLVINADPQKGSTVSVKGDFDVTVGFPANFAADSISLQAGDPNDPTKIDTSAFQGLESGKSYGQTGTGAASVTVKSGFDLKIVKL